MRVGIVAVHGVTPQIRYGFQDEVATNLCQRLNPDGSAKWQMSVVMPKNGTVAGDDVPTISRVHLATETDPENPTGDFFDVHEAYWSPIDKGRTNLLSVLLWLVNTIFAPFNDAARFRETPLKVAFDMTYVGAALVISLLCLYVSGCWAATMLLALLKCPSCDISFAWGQLVDGDALAKAIGQLLSPLSLVNALTPGIAVRAVVAFVGAVLLWQAFRSLFFVFTHMGRLLRNDGIQFRSRIIANLVLLLLSAGCLGYAAYTKFDGTHTLGPFIILVVVAVAFFDAARMLLTDFVVAFFGDVHVYTTRDQNSTFFGLREAILEKVVAVILNVVTKAPSGIPYDRVHIMAHSLGASIAMDAILRLYDVQQTSKTYPPAVITTSDWRRIRSFITFGMALEKTKYFFNAWSPTPSEKWEQWNGAVYGAIFTALDNTLAQANNQDGVFWHNNWYFTDFVSDQICSYRSLLLPRDKLGSLEHWKSVTKLRRPGTLARLVGTNRTRWGPWLKWPFWENLQTHTAYLEDPWFWKLSKKEVAANEATAPDEGAAKRMVIAVLDVLQSGMAGAPRTFEPAALPPRTDSLEKKRPPGYRASDRV